MTASALSGVKVREPANPPRSGLRAVASGRCEGKGAETPARGVLVLVAVKLLRGWGAASGTIGASLVAT